MQWSSSSYRSSKVLYPIVFMIKKLSSSDKCYLRFSSGSQDISVNKKNSKVKTIYFVKLFLTHQWLVIKWAFQHCPIQVINLFSVFLQPPSPPNIFYLFILIYLCVNNIFMLLHPNTNTNTENKPMTFIEPRWKAHLDI